VTVHQAGATAAKTMSKGNNSKLTSGWIFDSGASDHICSSLDWFTHYKHTDPLNVTLPNGCTIVAQYAGTIEFSPHFVLKDALYLPDFSLKDAHHCLVLWFSTVTIALFKI